MLGDSATRPRSRKGKRCSTEHSRESPCDWLSESGRVDHNNKTFKKRKHINKRGKPHKKGGHARGLVQPSTEKHTAIHKTTRYLIHSMLQSSQNTKYAQRQN